MLNILSHFQMQCLSKVISFFKSMKKWYEIDNTDDVIQMMTWVTGTLQMSMAPFSGNCLDETTSIIPSLLIILSYFNLYLLPDSKPQDIFDTIYTRVCVLIYAINTTCFSQSILSNVLLKVHPWIEKYSVPCVDWGLCKDPTFITFATFM